MTAKLQCLSSSTERCKGMEEKNQYADLEHVHVTIVQFDGL